MAGRGPNFTVIPNDWANLEYIISDLSSRILNEDTSFTDYILKDGTREYTGTGAGFKDEDDMASDSAVATASQQSIKAFVSSQHAFKTITGITNDVVADQAGDTLTLASGNNILGIVGTSATDTITFAIDQSNITGTGALNSGSITSGFGSIDVGANSITAEQLTSTDDITMQGHLLTLGDGSATDILMQFVSDGGTGTFTWEDAAQEWVFDKGMTIEGSLVVTAGLTTQAASEIGAVLGPVFRRLQEYADRLDAQVARATG